MNDRFERVIVGVESSRIFDKYPFAWYVLDPKFIKDFQTDLLLLDMLSFGVSLIQSISFIKDNRLEKYKEYCFASDISKFTDDEIFRDIIFNSLIDCIKVSIMFDNYCKFYLITNGYCIHQIDKSKKLKEYVDKPLPITEIIKLADRNKSTIDEYHKELKNLGLKENTHSLSVFINDNFKNLLFPKNDRLVSILKDIQNKRNKLHFLFYMESYFNAKEYENISYLIECINKDVLPLLRKYKPNSMDLKDFIIY